jgi:hypothetical protein
MVDILVDASVEVDNNPRQRVYLYITLHQSVSSTYV